MGAANVATNRLSAANVAIGVTFTVALAAIARASGLHADDLGLARSTWVRGLRWGSACAGIAVVGIRPRPPGTADPLPGGRFGAGLLAAHPGHGAGGDSAGDGDSRGVRVPRGALGAAAPPVDAERGDGRVVRPVRLVAHASVAGRRAGQPCCRPHRGHRSRADWCSERWARFSSPPARACCSASCAFAVTVCSHPCWHIGRSTRSARSSCSSPDEAARSARAAVRRSRPRNRGEHHMVTPSTAMTTGVGPRPGPDAGRAGDPRRRPPRSAPRSRSSNRAEATRPAARFHYSLPGAWVAVIFTCLAFTPSLVPRPGPFQGVVCGITAAIGYGLGVTGAFVWREFADRRRGNRGPLSWRVFLIVAVVALTVSYFLGEHWQRSLRALMDAAPEDLLPKVLLPVVAVLVFARAGGRRAWRPPAVPMGGTHVGSLDGSAGRACTGLGPGGSGGGRSGQWRAGGRHHRTDRSDLRDPGHHHQRHGSPTDHAASLRWSGFAGGLGLAGLPRSELRRAGPDRGRHFRVFRAPRLPNRSAHTPASPPPATSRIGPVWRCPIWNGRAGSAASTCWWRHDRNRLGRPRRHQCLRVRGRWRLGGSGDPVLLSSVLGVVPGGPVPGQGGGPGVVRRGVPEVVGAARRATVRSCSYSG